MDRFVTVTQGEVFYATELLARVEGLERGPAGNTSLAAAIAIAQEMDDDAIVVISETEYTGAGKSPIAQLEFARSMGVEVINGDSADDDPGRIIAIPTGLDQLRVTDVDLDDVRMRYVKRAAQELGRTFTEAETRFLADDARTDSATISRHAWVGP